MAKKILIVDDEPRLRKLVSDFLRKEGYLILEAENGRAAQELFAQQPGINLIILDVMMPEIDGWTVCREIRKTSRVPIMMLTARGEEFDELYGFEIGADEYVTKPFSLMILVARVNALFRRLEHQNGPSNSIGGLDINYAAHRVAVDGTSLDLSPKEYELLVYLTENQGKALSRLLCPYLLSRRWAS